MKYGFMSFSCPSKTLDEMLALAQEVGADGVEPRLNPDHAHGITLGTTPAERAEIRRKAEEAGIAYCCLATGLRFADPATVETNIEEAKRCIDLAADIGAPNLRVFGGRLPEGLSREDAIDVVTEALAELSEYAAVRRRTLCCETHDDWSDPVYWAEVMNRVRHRTVAINWDIFHPVMWAGHTVESAFELVKRWVEHVHFKDGVKFGERGKKFKLVGEGDIDLRRAIELLGSISYGGCISGEWPGWEPHGHNLAHDLAAMKSYES
jgi:sugar phosphate isomerase/epimerase